MPSPADLHTDYDALAQTYDEGELRHRVQADPSLESLIRRRGARRRLRALDLACGTGLYLRAQEQAFAASRLDLLGVDRSAGMLARARQRCEHSLLLRASADELPFDDGALDFVSNRFAFHHFAHKGRALDEIRRVLRAEGVFAMVNICPERSEHSLLYQFFPETRELDEGRYWPIERIEAALKKRGLHVRARVDEQVQDQSAAAFLDEVQRRDWSQLALLSDQVFARGCDRLRALLHKDPQARVRGRMALLHLHAASSAILLKSIQT